MTKQISEIEQAMWDAASDGWSGDAAAIDPQTAAEIAQRFIAAREQARPTPASIEAAAIALYDRNPQYDQEVDADLRPVSSPYRIPWDSDGLPEGYREDIREDVRSVLAALAQPTSLRIVEGEDQGADRCRGASSDARPSTRPDAGAE